MTSAPAASLGCGRRCGRRCVPSSQSGPTRRRATRSRSGRPRSPRERAAALRDREPAPDARVRRGSRRRSRRGAARRRARGNGGRSARSTSSLDRVGAFRGAGIAWAGASSVPAELAQLVAQLNDALTAQGFPTDARPFQAHVTLARRCRRQPRANQATPIAWTVATLVLNASDLGSGGPRYRELAAWPLGPRNGRDPWVQLPRG